MLIQLTSLLGLTQNPDSTQSKERASADIDFAQIFSELEDDNSSVEGDIPRIKDEDPEEGLVESSIENNDLDKTTSVNGDPIEDHETSDMESKIAHEESEHHFSFEQDTSAEVDPSLDPIEVPVEIFPMSTTVPESDSHSGTRSLPELETATIPAAADSFVLSETKSFSPNDPELGQSEKQLKRVDLNPTYSPETLEPQADGKKSLELLARVPNPGGNIAPNQLTPSDTEADAKNTSTIPFFTNRNIPLDLPLNVGPVEHVKANVTLPSAEKVSKEGFSLTQTVRQNVHSETSPRIPEESEHSVQSKRPLVVAQESYLTSGDTATKHVVSTLPDSSRASSFPVPRIDQAENSTREVLKASAQFSHAKFEDFSEQKAPQESLHISKSSNFEVSRNEFPSPVLNTDVRVGEQILAAPEVKVEQGAQRNESPLQTKQLAETPNEFPQVRTERRLQTPAPLLSNAPQLETVFSKKTEMAPDKVIRSSINMAEHQIDDPSSQPIELKHLKDVSNSTQISEQPVTSVFIDAKKSAAQPTSNLEGLVTSSEVQSLDISLRNLIPGKTDKQANPDRTRNREDIKYDSIPKHQTIPLNDIIEKHSIPVSADPIDIGEELPKLVQNEIEAPSRTKTDAAEYDIRLSSDSKSIERPPIPISEATGPKPLIQQSIGVNHPSLVGLDDYVGRPELAVLSSSSETRQISIPSPASSPWQASRQEATQVMRQISDGIQKMSEGGVELRLNPEELGSVRMQFTQNEQGLNVHILAERTETLDLIRRHIDQLAKELAESGFDATGFTFGDQGAQGNQKQLGPESRDLGIDEQTQTDQPVSVVHDGLDIRV